jgi:hypothetical protein
VSESLSRRKVIDLIVGLPVAAAAIAAVAAPASAKLAPSAIGYVPKSNVAGKVCSGCSLYIPGKTATAVGQCKQVSGPIAPGGYCNIWNAKKK